MLFFVPFFLSIKYPMDSCRSNPSSGEIIPWWILRVFAHVHPLFFGGNQTTMFLDLSYTIGRQFKDVHELNSTILLKRFPILKPLKWIPWNETTSSFRFVAGLIGRVYVHGWLDHGKPPPGAQIHRKICGVSRWFGGWFKVPHTCLSDSVFCVFFHGFFWVKSYHDSTPSNNFRKVLGTFWLQWGVHASG